MRKIIVALLGAAVFGVRHVSSGAIMSLSEPAALRDVALSGAPEFALDRVNQEQQSFSTPEHWMALESLRLDIYREEGYWDKLDKRVSLYDAINFLSPEFLASARLSQINALIRSGALDAASSYLTKLKLDDKLALNIDRDELADIEVALHAERGEFVEAAQRLTAYLRADDSRSTGLRRQQLAYYQLRAGRAVDVPAEWIEKGGILYAYQLLGRLITGQAAAEKVARMAQAAIYDGPQRLAEPAFLGVAALSAELDESYDAAIEFWERYLSARRDEDKLDKLFDASLSRLDRLYQRFGKALLVGASSGESSFMYGMSFVQERPARARSVFRVLMTAGETEEAALAAEQFAQSLWGDKRIELLVGFHLAGQGLPANASSHAWYLLSQGLIQQDMSVDAANIVATLDTPPEGMTPFAWALKRSRLLVRSGRLDEGLMILRAELEKDWLLDDLKIGQAMQIGFDLQLMGEHARAIDLFNRLYPLAKATRVKRELLFWIGDSYNAQQDSVVASQYYLRSATLENAFAFDPWAQTARYKAAEVLTQAGYLRDAKSLYLALYKATADASRRASIRQKLDALAVLSMESESGD